jgi:hypothetical protein
MEILMAGLRAKYVNWFARKIWKVGSVTFFYCGLGSRHLEEILHGFLAQVCLMRAISSDDHPYREVSRLFLAIWQHSAS